MTPPIFEGERRRDAGMALAAAQRQRQIWTAQLALLDAIRANPNRTATTDDAVVDLWARHPDGGRWRGSVPRQLALLGLIVPVGHAKSRRPCRHRGLLTVWQGADDGAADRYRAQLRAWLASSADIEADLFDDLEETRLEDMERSYLD